MRYVLAWSIRVSNIKTIKACVYLCRAYSLESYRCLRLQVSSWSGSGCYLMQVIALLSWIGLTKEWYSDILSRNEMCWCTDCCNVCLSNWIEDTLCDNLWSSRFICCYDMHRWPWDFFGCWAWLGIDLRGDNSGEKVRGCGNAETEQLYPFSFWCCANETSHGSFCGHHGVVRAASCAELLLGTFIWPDMARKCLKVDVGSELLGLGANLYLIPELIWYLNRTTYDWGLHLCS